MPHGGWFLRERKGSRWGSGREILCHGGEQPWGSPNWMGVAERGLALGDREDARR